MTMDVPRMSTMFQTALVATWLLRRMGGSETGNKERTRSIGWK
jgi:hypothetical protein